ASVVFRYERLSDTSTSVRKNKGYTLLTVQAYFELRPTPCVGVARDEAYKCETPSSGQEAILYVGLYLMALHVGGVKPVVLALGVEQFIEANKVSMAAIRNAKLVVPDKAQELHEIYNKEGGRKLKFFKKVTTSGILYNNFLIFLDRAVIVRTDISSTSIVPNPWKQYTITQVEETKHIIRMLPIMLCTVLMNICFAQLQTFSIGQANTIDRDLFGFKVPGASIHVIPMLFMLISIPIYDCILVPFVRRFTGIQTGIRSLQWIGVVLLLSAISMGIAGIIETLRKNAAIEQNMVNSTKALPISLFWLSFQYVIFGFADMFAVVGLPNFLYSENPSGMRALGTAISWLSLGL
ncbi:protein NRT1/ PTR FAMILY 4.5-like, partial [Rutidosis leptorrhynchoides]|uniref:protein NRT1/ PTR FAMILY 4.5-like n=1 Tax=Rutidosis leptorrhynchoides TaxID=125765 RepID=UPI003A9A1080